jgi:hypothetical protein
MKRRFIPIFYFLLFGLAKTNANDTLKVFIPDLIVWADQLNHGDTDIYGLGEWQCSVIAEVENGDLILRGKIVFSEKSNDFTVISGKIDYRIPIKNLGSCYDFEVISIEKNKGNVNGENRGASGFHKFLGKGIIRSANIITDTFGGDVGKIGGTIKFQPIFLIVKYLSA